MGRIGDAFPRALNPAQIWGRIGHLAQAAGPLARPRYGMAAVAAGKIDFVRIVI